MSASIHDAANAATADGQPGQAQQEETTYGGFAARTPSVVTLRGGAGLHGSEGVAVALRGPSDGCEVLIDGGGGSRPFLPLHHNLWLSEEAWRVDGAVKLYDHRE